MSMPYLNEIPSPFLKPIVPCAQCSSKKWEPAISERLLVEDGFNKQTNPLCISDAPWMFSQPFP